MTELLVRAATQGIAIHVWFAGLATVELHIARVRRRVAKGGHDIAEDTIRRRFLDVRRNLIRLLPNLSQLYLYDNSVEGDPDAGGAPSPRLVMHCRARRIIYPADLANLLRLAPAWAKPIVATALKLHLRGQAGSSPLALTIDRASSTPPSSGCPRCTRSASSSSLALFSRSMELPPSRQPSSTIAIGEAASVVGGRSTSCPGSSTGCCS